MRLRISKIEARASERSPGYVTAVLERGEVDGEWLEISDEALAELRTIYRPAPTPVLSQPSTRPEPALPGVGVMLKLAATAVVAEASARLRGVPALDTEETTRRLAICTGPAGGDPCEHFRPSDARCALCTCFAAYKTKLRSQACPAGKW